jgi:hypothetical protein
VSDRLSIATDDRRYGATGKRRTSISDVFIVRSIERASISRTTLTKRETGVPGVCIGNVATVLFALGLVDRLWAHLRKGKESATFEYDDGWLDYPERLLLEPALEIGPGPFHAPAEQPLFDAIGDAAP